MEKDVSDLVEECEPELVIALPQVRELDEGVSLDPAGGTVGAEPRHRWNQCERHPAVRRRAWGLLNGLHRILDCE